MAAGLLVLLEAASGSPWILPSWASPGAPARMQCPSSQQQSRAVPSSSDLVKGKCPALLQERITPSTMVGVARKAKAFHIAPTVMQGPRMAPQSQGQGQPPAIATDPCHSPATAIQGLALLQGHGWVQHTVVLFPREEEGRGQGTNLNRMKTIHWK